MARHYPRTGGSFAERRHSCAVGNWLQGQTEDEGLKRRSSLRRPSLADLDSLTRSMSAKLSFVQRRSSFSSSLELGDVQLTVDKKVVQEALCRHYHDSSVKVFQTWNKV